MHTAGIVLEVVGGLVALIGYWQAIREMFSVSRSLGYLAVLFPIAALAYSAMRMDELKASFWIQLTGYLLLICGIVLTSQF